jgi:effector-binding domain-containing protein
VAAEDDRLTYEIVIETVTARRMAAVRRRVRVGEVASAWKPALDQVWAFLRRHDDLRSQGHHNIFVYHHPTRPGEPMEVDFGVEVTGTFAGEGEVVATQTPSGSVVSTLHVGPADRLAGAHAAIAAWCAEHGRVIGAASWEIYGDWTEDPSTFEVRVIYLLA